MALVKHVSIRSTSLWISGKQVPFDENGLAQVEENEAVLLAKDCPKEFSIIEMGASAPVVPSVPVQVVESPEKAPEEAPAPKTKTKTKKGVN